MFGNIFDGFLIVIQWQNILVIIVGIGIGYFVGAMPGLTSTVGVALMIPFTFGLSPETGLILLVTVYMSTMYGGSIPAILINTPGTPAAACTAIEGYPLTQQGKAAMALGTSMIACAIGSLLGTLALMFFSVPMAHYGLKFGPSENFAMGIFGLTVVGSLSGKSWIKGLIVALAGLLLTTIGTDPVSGHPRYVFSFYVLDGIEFIPALIGLFAISEVFVMFEQCEKTHRLIQKAKGKLPSWTEIWKLLPTILRSTGIGYFIGMIPGEGGAIASFISYGSARKRSKNPDLYGNGSLEGIAAAESSNNAAVAGALVPTLTLGIPGSSSTAVLLGGLLINGLVPGPFLFIDHAPVVYSLFVSLLVSMPLMFCVGYFGIPLWVNVVQTPINILAPIVLLISVLGSFALTNSMVSVWTALIFGIMGYILKKTKYPVTPMVLALVLGKLIESNFRRSLLISQGSFSIFFTRPITLTLLVLSVLSILAPYLMDKIVRKSQTS